MTTPATGARRGPTAPLAALLVVLLTGLVAVLVMSSAAAQAPAAVRIDGADPVAASVAISDLVFDDAGAGGGVTAVHAVLGRDDAFADSLAAGPLMGGGPLLYAPGGESGALPAEVAAELQRILPPGSVVYLAGGTAAVSTAVEQTVEDLGYLTIRLGGEERTETAALIAAEAARLYGDVRTVLVAAAGSWPDAVAGASLAASGSGSAGALAIVLTDGEAVSPAAEAFVAEHPDAEVVVLGGTAVITDDVAAAVGFDRRLAGPTRADTAAAIEADFGDDVTGATVIQGFVDDGWVLGNAGASLLQPLLLNGPSADEVNGPTGAGLSGRVELVVLGGTDRVSDAGVAALEDAR